MTGVVEVGLAAAAIGAVLHTRNERQLEEERVADEIYRRFFYAPLHDRAPERAAGTMAALPSELDRHAAASIKAIERYQRERKRRFLSLSSSQERTGDVRTRVTEELKQWLLTVAGGAAIAGEVAVRLEYCFQFLLRASVFAGQNPTSFLRTMAEVCRQLDLLLREATGRSRTAASQLGELLQHGLALLKAMVPMLLCSLPAPLAAAGVPPLGPPSAPVVLAELVAAACYPDSPDLRPATTPRPGLAAAPFAHLDVGRLLFSLFAAPHFQRLCPSRSAAAPGSPECRSTAEPGEEESPAQADLLPQGEGQQRVSSVMLREQEEVPQPVKEEGSPPSPGAAETQGGVAEYEAEVASSGLRRGAIEEVAREVGSRWHRLGGPEACAEEEARSGLLPAFCRGALGAEARDAYIRACTALDRTGFFLDALRPYYELCGAAGDLGLCWLRRGLVHLLQELVGALVHLRQARLEVMRVAKRQLQEVAKTFTHANTEETVWLQGLRFIDELQLDRSHREIVERCALLSSASSVARERQLSDEARLGLHDALTAAQSPDFQARCSGPLPASLANDLGQLNLLDGRLQRPALAWSPGA